MNKNKFLKIFSVCFLISSLLVSEDVIFAADLDEQPQVQTKSCLVETGPLGLVAIAVSIFAPPLSAIVAASGYSASLISCFSGANDKTLISDNQLSDIKKVVVSQVDEMMAEKERRIKATIDSIERMTIDMRRDSEVDVERQKQLLEELTTELIKEIYSQIDVIRNTDIEMIERGSRKLNFKSPQELIDRARN